MENFIALYFVCFGLYALYRIRRTPQVLRGVWQAYRYTTSTAPGIFEEVTLAAEDFPLDFDAAAEDLQRLGYRFLLVQDMKSPHLPQRMRVYTFTDEGIITASLTFKPDGTRASIALWTRFTDGMDVNTSTPGGDTLDTPLLHVRFARTLEAADAYHRQVVDDYRAQGRTPLPVLTLADIEQASVLTARAYRRPITRRFRIHNCRLLFILIVTMLAPFGVIAAGLTHQWILGAIAGAVWYLGVLSSTLIARRMKAWLAHPDGAIDDPA